MIFKTILVTDLNKERVNLKDQDHKRLAENIERELKYEVEEMISQVWYPEYFRIPIKLNIFFPVWRQVDRTSSSGRETADKT